MRRRTFGTRLGIEVGLGLPAFFDERPFVRAGQVPAGGDEKRAAAHRRIDDAKRKDGIRRRAAHERRERASHDELRERLRCVERAGLLAADGMLARLRRPSAGFGGVEIEDALVHGAELLDA